jgi:prepilin-type N-terminal cleavage/methylation domain-containing protein
MSQSSTKRRAFTLLELVVAMIVLAAGLLAIQGLMVRQSRQISHLEAWCFTPRTYYVVNPASNAMQLVGVPAELADAAGQTAWTPPVTGANNYVLTLESLSLSADGQQVAARVTQGSP